MSQSDASVHYRIMYLDLKTYATHQIDSICSDPEFVRQLGSPGGRENLKECFRSMDNRLLSVEVFESTSVMVHEHEFERPRLVVVPRA